MNNLTNHLTSRPAPLTTAGYGAAVLLLGLLATTGLAADWPPAAGVMASLAALVVSAWGLMRWTFYTLTHSAMDEGRAADHGVSASWLREGTDR